MQRFFAEMMKVNVYKIFQAYNDGLTNSSITEDVLAAVGLEGMMPDFSRLKELRTTHNYPELANPPIVAVSASLLPVEIIKGLDVSASKYINKTASYYKLIRAVDNPILAADQERIGI